MPDAVKAATDTYRMQMDSLGDFLTERCVLSCEATATAKELYESYVDWSEKSGERQISKKAFGMRLEERGFHKGKTSRERFWCGLRLRTPGEAQESEEPEADDNADAEEQEVVDFVHHN